MWSNYFPTNYQALFSCRAVSLFCHRPTSRNSYAFFSVQRRCRRAEAAWDTDRDPAIRAEHQSLHAMSDSDSFRSANSGRRNGASRAHGDSPMHRTPDWGGVIQSSRDTLFAQIKHRFSNAPDTIETTSQAMWRHMKRRDRCTLVIHTCTFDSSSRQQISLEHRDRSHTRTCIGHRQSIERLAPVQNLASTQIQLPVAVLGCP